jgi:hypothetical protein
MIVWYLKYCLQHASCVSPTSFKFAVTNADSFSGTLPIITDIDGFELAAPVDTCLKFNGALERYLVVYEELFHYNTWSLSCASFSKH